MLKLNKVYCGDCQTIMEEIDEGSISLTITSPPYDKLRKYENTNEEWCEETWKNILLGLYRITKEGGVVIWVVEDSVENKSESGTSFKQALFAKDVVGFKLYATMIYEKLNVLPKNDKRYEQSFEYMFVLLKGDHLATFNPIKQPSKCRGRLQTGTFWAMIDGKDTLKRKHGWGTPTKGEKMRRNIWSYAVGVKKKDEKKHPAVFPKELAEDHIKSWSNPGDTILDPMAGSGTVGLAAKKLMRKYIMIEKVPEYAALCKEKVGDKIGIREFLGKG